ncbi:MAG: hypothetical protein A2817_01405 [Candidatus Yanofskybacteria bacterium RIFCSPHIGHO2_01_FULL_39_8b]|uniref:YbaK/aminoacyl-tRNA synthetase-associated domain-containing protein n=1 Tax=Candidatus Yanofskybacteria bacterium RIFCSPHIGHO2_01_FULL_39_8b TaxID=1802659 RepID=A0A1F8E8K7_9BACT|nr:MAG: hypothetical protein A2817_01405 [Candidatus Yanofskybacteria bacterium RIFCSPHIGHO2_01_FULL_39_8b]
MPIPKKIEAYLRKTNKKFYVIAHKTVYTGYDLAQTLRKSLSSIAKTLVVKTDKGYALVILPASSRLDLKKLKKILKVKKVTIPGEKIMSKVFKVKPGAISAFGKFHKVDTVVDKSIMKAKDVIFQAGSFTDSVMMKAKDFIEAEGALLGDFAQKANYTLQKNTVKAKKPARKKKV